MLIHSIRDHPSILNIYCNTVKCNTDKFINDITTFTFPTKNKLKKVKANDATNFIRN